MNHVLQLLIWLIPQLFLFLLLKVPRKTLGAILDCSTQWEIPVFLFVDFSFLWLWPKSIDLMPTAPSSSVSLGTSFYIFWCSQGVCSSLTLHMLSSQCSPWIFQLFGISKLYVLVAPKQLCGCLLLFCRASILGSGPFSVWDTHWHIFLMGKEGGYCISKVI